MSDLPITSGRFWAAVAAFRAVMTSGPALEDELSQNLVRLGESISSAMTQDGIELLKLCELIEKEDKSVAAGRLAKTVWKDEESNGRENVAQRLLFQLIRGPRRDLSVIAFLEPEGVRDQHPEVFELIRDTGLLDVQNSGYSDFWSKLKTLGTFSSSPASLDQREKRGIEAEELSLRFEASRLKIIGYPDLARQISHVSSNTLLGFDILSFTGDKSSPRETLEIEVKNLSVNSRGQMYFHISRNEARRAETSPNKYIFHLWQTFGEEPVCFIEQSGRILEHLPRELSDYATWESCIVIWSEISDSRSISY